MFIFFVICLFHWCDLIRHTAIMFTNSPEYDTRLFTLWQIPPVYWHLSILCLRTWVTDCSVITLQMTRQIVFAVKACVTVLWRKRQWPQGVSAVIFLYFAWFWWLQKQTRQQISSSLSASQTPDSELSAGVRPGASFKGLQVKTGLQMDLFSSHMAWLFSNAPWIRFSNIYAGPGSQFSSVSPGDPNCTSSFLWGGPECSSTCLWGDPEHFLAKSLKESRMLPVLG